MKLSTWESVGNRNVEETGWLGRRGGSGIAAGRSRACAPGGSREAWRRSGRPSSGRCASCRSACSGSGRAGRTRRESSWRSRGDTPRACRRAHSRRGARDGRGVRPGLGVVVHVHDDVVDDRAIARDGLGRLDPPIFLEVRGDPQVDVRQDSLGGDGVGLGDLEDGIGGADGPPFRELLGGGERLGIAQGAPLVDPGEERGPLARGQAPVVLEVPVAWVGVPGGHPAVVHHLADGRGVAAGVVVGPQRERADLARPVARLALLLDDPRRRRRTSPGRPRPDPWPPSLPGRPRSPGPPAGPSARPSARLADHGPGLGPVQQATGDRRGGRLDLLAGQDRVERLAQIRVAGDALRAPWVYWSSIAPR